jgi:transposase
MKDGRTHLAHKAEHAVDLETGAVLAVTLQPADRGDTTTIMETLAEAGENVADLIAREAAEPEPGVHLEGIVEVVGDKGYHSGAALVRLKECGVRTYIPEKKQAGKRHWIGKKDEQQAVYANRQRVSGNYGKSLLRKRGELIERSFAHCYDTGAMRRTHLRGHENILKRQLIHVGAFNLSLIFRSLIGAGTPRELKNRLTVLIFVLERLLNTLRHADRDLNALTFPHRVPRLSHHALQSSQSRPSKDGVTPRAARRSAKSSGAGRAGHPRAPRRGRNE